MGDIAERPGAPAAEELHLRSRELLVDLLLLQRPPQLPALCQWHNDRNDLFTMSNHIVSVTVGKLAHEAHINVVRRQPSVRTEVQIRAVDG